MDFLLIKKDELYAELQAGRELEFSLEKHKYFIGSQGGEKYLWDETEQKMLMKGALDDIFS